jgi:hypothetical protein
MLGIGRGGLCALFWTSLLACSSTTDTPSSAGGTDAGKGAEVAASGSSAVAGGGLGAGAGAGVAGASVGEQGGTAAAEPSGGGGAGAGNRPSVEEIMVQYRSWHPQSEPRDVSAHIFGLCRLPTLPEQSFAESEHGQSRYLQEWVNPEAREGIEAMGAPAFPVGAVIVKEKYAFADGDTALDLVALGIMIKRQAGFNAAHANWHYAYYEPELGILQTQEQSDYCAGCHAAAAETDHVYLLDLVPK